MKNNSIDFTSIVVKLIISFMFLFIIISCGSNQDDSQQVIDKSVAPNTLTKEEIKTGWKLLFGGKSFAGWRGLGMKGISEGHWVVEDGTIKKLAKEDIPLGKDGKLFPGGDLMTIETFENYEFSIEWKVGKGSNSGIKYNVSEELSMSRGGKHSALGFEYQVLDDEGYTGSLKPTQKAGALYDLIPPQPKVLNPVGEFNKSKIFFQGNHGDHWLNGKKLLEYEIGSARMDSLVAISKFRNIPGFADKKKGHIVLQVHPGETWYRNIKIRELP